MTAEELVVAGCLTLVGFEEDANVEMLDGGALETLVIAGSCIGAATETGRDAIDDIPVGQFPLEKVDAVLHFPMDAGLVAKAGLNAMAGGCQIRQRVEGRKGSPGDGNNVCYSETLAVNMRNLAFLSIRFQRLPLGEDSPGVGAVHGGGGRQGKDREASHGIAMAFQDVWEGDLWGGMSTKGRV